MKDDRKICNTFRLPAPFRTAGTQEFVPASPLPLLDGPDKEENSIYVSNTSQSPSCQEPNNIVQPAQITNFLVTLVLNQFALLSFEHFPGHYFSHTLIRNQYLSSNIWDRISHPHARSDRNIDLYHTSWPSASCKLEGILTVAIMVTSFTKFIALIAP
jgi:hypothetical protein